jgi:hypothetical protein
MAIQLFRCPYCDRDNSIGENAFFLHTGMTLQCTHCKTELETFLINREGRKTNIDTLIKLASMFCPQCFNPTKLEKTKNGSFRIYCNGYGCMRTSWYSTETQARESWVEKAAEILVLERKDCL